jgi:sugar lactone lactonase YvrE
MSCPLVAAVSLGADVWFTNNGNNNVIELVSPFSSTNYNTYSGGGLDKPIGIAFFAYYNPSLVSSVWLANSGSDSLTEFGTAGGPVNYTGGGLSDPSGIAVDGSGNMWAIGISANQVAEFNDTGTAVSPVGGWTGGGLDGPSRIAIDGANNVWITNKTNSSLTEFNNSGTPITPSTGYQSSTLLGPVWIAIDASGNVWAVNTTESAPGYETVTVFLGVASPTSMPIQESLPVV